MVSMPGGPWQILSRAQVNKAERAGAQREGVATVARPGVCGILDKRATAKWSPGLDEVCEVAEEVLAFGVWLE